MDPILELFHNILDWGVTGPSIRRARRGICSVEVQPVRQRLKLKEKVFYDNKIDIWRFGIAMARALVDVQKLDDKITPVWHDECIARAVTASMAG